MRIAYMILAHDQPELFGRLARAIHADNVSIYAHIDAKFDSAPFRAAAANIPVGFVGDPVKVNWGGFSQVESMLKLLTFAARSGQHDYFIFLSGRDYPLRPHNELLSLLAEKPTRSYMNFYPLSEGADFVSKVRNYCYYDIYAKIPTRFLKRVANRLVKEVSARLPDRQFIPNMQPYRGSTSWCITREIAEYIIGFVEDNNNSKYLDFFRSVSCCDEIFFQTIVLNSSHAASLNLYEIDGSRRPGEMKNENKASLHYIDWNPEREDPAILDEGDYEQMRSSAKYFARKFDAVRSARVLEQIDSYRQPRDEVTYSNG